MTKRILVLHFPLTPVAKQRPKFSSKGGRSKAYTPEKTLQYEKSIGDMARAMLMGNGITEFPVYSPNERLHVDFDFVFPRTKGTINTKESEYLWPGKTVDTDNLVKAASDGLEKVLWKNDSQIVSIRARKFAGKRYEKAGVYIAVGVVEDVPQYLCIDPKSEPNCFWVEEKKNERQRKEADTEAESGK